MDDTNKYNACIQIKPEDWVRHQVKRVYSQFWDLNHEAGFMSTHRRKSQEGLHYTIATSSWNNLHSHFLE